MTSFNCNPFLKSLLPNHKYVPFKTFVSYRSLWPFTSSDGNEFVTWCDEFHRHWGRNLDSKLEWKLDRPNFGQPVFEDIVNQELLDNANTKIYD